MTTQRLRTWLFNGGGMVLAAALLYLAFRGIQWEALVDAFRHANYWWLVPLTALVLGSNVLRVIRWQLLLRMLPDRAHRSIEADPKQIGFMTAFASTMIGYMANYVAPRAGEFARTGHLALKEHLRFSSVFGTVVVERMLDTAVLAVALITGLWYVRGRIGEFLDAAPVQLPPWMGDLAFWGALVAVFAALLAMIGAWLFPNATRRTRAWYRLVVRPVLHHFWDGIDTLRRTKHPWALVATTLGMWGGYLLMAYIPFRMLHIAAPYGIGLADAWALMAIGALGLLVPAPGGLGSFHYITILALGVLYGMPEAPAASYAVLTHAAQLVFYTGAGALCILAYGTGLRELRKASSRAAEAAETTGTARADS
ncbi:MAG: lysylphosphatidylglycerol synthase transmembrane domain-containing protein [Longimonas sp.]|uniref:lysylphosphatidylglycerol synthase transmembrane domain-containing protein n=1 Tax=Longimonas sp. TaxID=2039626 RepID=UPI003347B8EE